MFFAVELLTWIHLLNKNTADIYSPVRHLTDKQVN